MCWLCQSAQLWYFPSFLLVPLMLVAGLECFAGYYTWRFLIGLNGAVIGFVAGAMLGMLLGPPMLVLLGAIAGALGGAALFYRVVPLGSFVFTFSSAGSLAIILGRAAFIPANWLMLVAVGTGLTSAIVVLTGRRAVMIVIAAIAGAQQIAGAWRAYFLPGDCVPLPHVIPPSEWAGFVTLAAVGLMVQFATSRARRAGHAGCGRGGPV